jgi:hypothetical protein
LGVTEGEAVGAVVTVGATVVAGRVPVEAVPVAVGKMGSMVREPVSVETGAVPVAVAIPVAVLDGESVPEFVAVPVYMIFFFLKKKDGEGRGE